MKKNPRPRALLWLLGTASLLVLAACGTQETPATTFDLSVTIDGDGAGVVTSDPAGIDSAADATFAFDEGTEVTLTATAAPGSEFSGWAGDCAATTATTCTVTMDAAKAVTATFSTVVTTTEYELNVTVNGDGTVTSVPAGIDTSVPGGSTSAFDEGTEVTLTATAAAGSAFDAWTGDCDSTTTDPDTCTVTMDADKHVTAVVVGGPPSPTPSLRPLETIDCAGAAVGDDCLLRVGWTASPEPYRGLEFVVVSDAFALGGATLGSASPAGCWIASGPAKIVIVCDAPWSDGGVVADVRIERTGPVPASVTVADARIAVGADAARSVPGGTLVVGDEP